MQLSDGTTLFSATALVAYLEREHLTGLDFRALGEAVKGAGRVEPDETAELVARKGDEHEKAYLRRLQAEGSAVVDRVIESPPDGVDNGDRVHITETATTSPASSGVAGKRAGSKE